MKTEKQRVHFVDKYLINPTNPITVNLIGAGGTGSQVLTALARINHALTALNHAGLSVHVFDGDVITKANLGRQLFAEAEVGLPKAVALVNRINRFFGTNWKARAEMFTGVQNAAANIVITCVDTAAARFEIAETLQHRSYHDRHTRNRLMYWFDFGNGQDTGQDSWGPRMEYILRFALLTLLYQPEATLLDIQPLLTQRESREKALIYVEDENITAFWRNEFDRFPPALRAEAISPILNKTGLFITCTPLRKIVGQPTSSLRLQQVLDTGKIFIVNLSKGQIGEDASSLLGAMLVNAIQLAALHRASMAEDKRRPFYLYIDECHSFVTLSFTTILSEARKYGLSLFLAHQYIEQMDERIRAAIFGNVGTLISFRVGAADAEYLEQEFFPVFTKTDFVNLPRYAMYIKLMIDGTASQPFSAISLPKK